MLVCEAAGFDIVIVETVGVGQSETAVAGMTDVFVLLQLPNAGDDLQAIKKGIVELADIVVYNKCDIDETAAERAMQQMRGALHLLRAASAGWTVPVLKVSALQHAGLEAFWADILRYRDTMQASGAWTARRSRQALDWMWTLVDQGLRSRFEHHAAVRAALPDIRAAVAAGTLPASAAALRLLQAMD